MIITRTIAQAVVERAAQFPVVTITGPRQSGKTTLCRQLFPEKPYVNLEALDVRRYAQDDPRGFLAAHPDGAILDEIQRVPELLSYIQVIVDERRRPGQFVLTGSQQFELMTTISQSLAGRTALLKLLPLSIEELASCGVCPGIDSLLLQGFYPRIYGQNIDPTPVLGDYLVTYVERDIRQLSNIKDLALFEKFVRLCAGRVGQLLNLQSLGNDVGVSHTTARAWLTVLEASYVVFLLQPWHANFSKRQIKAPKLYFYDVGLAAFLLGLENTLQVSRDPLRGNLFENMAVVEALKYRFNRGKQNNLFFFRDSKGLEVDLILTRGRELFPIEIKAGATIASDYFTGLEKFGVRAGLSVGNCGLIYGGDEIQHRTKAEVYPITHMYGLLNNIMGDD